MGISLDFCLRKVGELDIFFRLGSSRDKISTSFVPQILGLVRTNVVQRKHGRARFSYCGMSMSGEQKLFLNKKIKHYFQIIIWNNNITRYSWNFLLIFKILVIFYMMKILYGQENRYFKADRGPQNERIDANGLNWKII